MCARTRACTCASVYKCMYVCSTHFCAWIMEDSGQPSVSLSIQFWERDCDQTWSSLSQLDWLLSESQGTSSTAQGLQVEFVPFCVSAEDRTLVLRLVRQAH